MSDSVRQGWVRSFATVPSRRRRHEIAIIQTRTMSGSVVRAAYVPRSVSVSLAQSDAAHGGRTVPGPEPSRCACSVQTIGLGGMRHNTVLVGWPYEWRQNNEERSWKVFLGTSSCSTGGTEERHWTRDGDAVWETARNTSGVGDCDQFRENPGFGQRLQRSLLWGRKDIEIAAVSDEGQHRTLPPELIPSGVHPDGVNLRRCHQFCRD